MNYNFIVNPLTNRKVSLQGRLGKIILNKYLSMINSSYTSTNQIGSAQGNLLEEISFAPWANISDVKAVYTYSRQLSDDHSEYTALFAHSWNPTLGISRWYILGSIKIGPDGSLHPGILCRYSGGNIGGTKGAMVMPGNYQKYLNNLLDLKTGEPIPITIQGGKEQNNNLLRDVSHKKFKIAGTFDCSFLPNSIKKFEDTITSNNYKKRLEEIKNNSNNQIDLYMVETAENIINGIIKKRSGHGRKI